MSSKLFILALFAVLATVSLAQPTICTPNPDFPDDETGEECLFNAAHPDGGNCYYSSMTHPFYGCELLVAEKYGYCEQKCRECLQCIFDFGCCERGYQTPENMTPCMTNCQFYSPL